MNKLTTLLAGLLVVQLVLAIAVNLGGDNHGSFRAEQQLLAFDVDAVDGVRIEATSDSVLLSMRDGKWLLPDSGDFPASTGSVERLLDALSSLKAGWPVATTGSAARRFKVAGEAFERKLTLTSGDETLTELYVGSSPGFRKVHVRPAHEDAVFSVAFNSWEASASADDWIDKEVLVLEASEVERVVMPGLELRTADGSLQLANLDAGEETNADAVRSLVDKISDLRIQSLLDTGTTPEDLQVEPVLEMKVTRKGGEELHYRFSKPEEAAYYVLQRSDLDYIFKVPEFAVDPIREIAREQLVKSKAAVEPAAASAETTEAPDRVAVE